MAIKIAGDIFGYYGRERGQYNDAFSQYGSPSAEEQELMKQQVEAVRQASFDRQNTMKLVLGQMGFKLGTGEDGAKKLIPLTNDERKALMSDLDKTKSDISKTYQGRAQAAAKGETKLPSFLKKDIDYQKVKEEALLGELLGPDAMKSTAGQQALESLRKKEEQVRQQIQEQDLATAPGKAMGLSGQLAQGRGSRIDAYNSLPGQGASLIAGRGSILQQMQQRRLDELKKRYAELESKRQRITSAFTLGGTVGGAAISAANSRQKEPTKYNTTYNPSYGTSYNTDYGQDKTAGTSYDTADWVYGR